MLLIPHFKVMITPLLAASLFGQMNKLSGSPVPEFVGKEWLNVEKPLKMSDRLGRVTLVYFWTFACSNCQNNLPAIRRISESFKKQGVEVISIHTPELSEERDVNNVKKAVAKYGIKYPVLIDCSSTNWKAWKAEAWPLLYLVDKHNKVRANWVGELNYGDHTGEADMSRTIRGLLAEK